eukprot:350427-Pleurochrysis_carterae.AAC.1
MLTKFGDLDKKTLTDIPVLTSRPISGRQLEQQSRAHSFTHDAIFGRERHPYGVILTAQSYEEGCWLLLQPGDV